MSGNSSSTTNNLLYSYGATVDTYINIVFSALRAILLLTFSTLVLYLGYQRWRRQRSFTTASHSDIFTYHMAVMELMWVMGCICSFGSSYIIKTVGPIATSIAFYGEIFFHILTCVDRYLAVVHPITYLGLRNSRGVRIRNISIGCVWLLCFGFTSATALLTPSNKLIPLLCLFALSIGIISFCSLCVLCVLIRLGPGEGGREKVQVDQSKQRAFYTFTAITCTVWFSFVGFLVSVAVSKSPQLSNSVKTVVGISAGWFNLPSCLVLPLLYLHRAGKL